MTTNTNSRSWIAWIAFWCIRLVHGVLMPSWLRNPAAILREMGVREGLRVLEVGCGPGGFTVPAANLVGGQGSLLAVDVNPYATDHVREVLHRRGLDQAEVRCVNAAESGLPEGSTDLAFFIGVPRVVGGLGPVLREVHRVLTADGTVAFHLGRHDEGEMQAVMDRAGFVPGRAAGRLRLFHKYGRGALTPAPDEAS